jgi:hypothetical protein
MKDNINIVIIEDDLSQQQMYKDTVDTFNLTDEKYNINSEIMGNDDLLPKYLYENRCDCIVVDLNWGNNDVNNSGNKLINKIKKDKRIPIIVVSGNLHLLEDDLVETILFKKHQRDCDFLDVIKEIIYIFNTGYTTSLGNCGKIDEVITEVFWKYLSNNIDEWKDLEKELRDQRLLRYSLTRVNEMLSLSEEKHDIHNAIEFYIKPTMRSTAFNGDIVIYNDCRYVIISASCDMEQGNNDYVVMCKLNFEDFRRLMNDIKQVEIVSNGLKGKLNDLVNNKVQRFHLLPPCKNFQGAKVDFQQVLTLSKEELNEKCIIEATISPSFAKDIQARFSHYYGRQGQPQLDLDEIILYIKNN